MQVQNNTKGPLTLMLLDGRTKITVPVGISTQKDDFMKTWLSQGNARSEVISKRELVLNP